MAAWINYAAYYFCEVVWSLLKVLDLLFVILLKQDPIVDVLLKVFEHFQQSGF